MNSSQPCTGYWPYTIVDIVQQYHADLAQRLADEAAQIPRRTPILERLHEREQQNMEYGGIDK